MVHRRCRCSSAKVVLSLAICSSLSGEVSGTLSACGAAAFACLIEMELSVRLRCSIPVVVWSRFPHSWAKAWAFVQSHLRDGARGLAFFGPFGSWVVKVSVA